MTDVRSVCKVLRREKRLVVFAYHCNKCDKYHVKLRDKEVCDRDRHIVRLLALGLNTGEIASELKVTRRVVEHRIEKMKWRLYATSASNLVALYIAFGEISVADLLPKIEPKTHL